MTFSFFGLACYGFSNSASLGYERSLPTDFDFVSDFFGYLLSDENQFLTELMKPYFLGGSFFSSISIFNFNFCGETPGCWGFGVLGFWLGLLWF